MPSLTVNTLDEIPDVDVLIKEDDGELKNWKEEELSSILFLFNKEKGKREIQLEIS